MKKNTQKQPKRNHQSKHYHSHYHHHESKKTGAMDKLAIGTMAFVVGVLI